MEARSSPTGGWGNVTIMGKLELDKTNISLWGCACQDRVDGNKNLEEAPTYLTIECRGSRWVRAG